MNKLFFGLSLICNLLLGLLLLLNIRGCDDPEVVTEMTTIPDFEITSTENFEAVFIEKNDSIYKRLWGKAFENEPEKAFLISCSYFFLTKNQDVIKDIEVSESQLETMYHKSILYP